MFESSQPVRSPPDPVRIVYHAGDRTFARLFNEHSLEEIKNVVRRKLDLGSETDVALKQMGPGMLLDLEDDGDFQAFRVLLKSSVSVDIQVNVGRSQGSALPGPIVPRLQERSATSETTTTTSSVSFSKEPIGVTTPVPPSARPEVARATEASVTPAKTSLARKRKVSFNDVGITPVASTSIVSAEPAESPTVEPPKKKLKKESTKKKEVQTTAAVESPATKPAPKSRSRKNATSDRVSKDAETTEPPPKKPRKQKKSDSTKSKKSSAPIEQNDVDQPIGQPDNGINAASLQLAAEQPGWSDVEDDPSERAACAAIPQTSASTSVESEVTAAILSGCLSNASVTIPPKPPAKRKSVKRVSKKSPASSSALPVELATVLDAPPDEVSNVPTEQRLEKEVLTNEPSQWTPDLNGPPCPICLGEPFHIRYYCPIVLKGPDAIRERLEELKRTNASEQRSLIKQLEGLLHESKVMSEPSLDAEPTDNVQSRKVSPLPNASLRTLNIPRNSYLSEVTMESKDERSTSESSDDGRKGVERQVSSAPQRQKRPNKQVLPSNHDLEAVIRGPAPKQQSILHIVDRIARDEDAKGSDSDDIEAELEEDTDEDAGRPKRRSSRHIIRSSDSESEEEESRSPSPSHSANGALNHLPPNVQGSKNSAKESVEPEEGDVIMRDSADTSVSERQDGGSSEETRVGSDDRIVVDELPGEKDAAIIVEVLASPGPTASVLPPLDALRSESQEAGITEAEPALDQDDSVPVASDVAKEVDADPIEPADDLAPLTGSRTSNADPIEALSEGVGPLFANTTQSTPKPGVSKRIKSRDGEIPSEADRPVLLEELALEATDTATPTLPKGKTRRKVMDMPASQEPALPRRSPRFSSLPPAISTPTSTPLAVVLLNHKSKSGAWPGRATKTPAKQSEERSDFSKSSAKDAAEQSAPGVAPTPSLVAWEAMAEPSSPSLQPDEPSMHIDELMSSSPAPGDNPIRRPNVKVKKAQTSTPATSGQAETSQKKERLFDLSPSQVPFPYSQNFANLVPSVSPNGMDSEGATDSEDEPITTKKNTKMPVRYRSLSQLASQATLFSPSLPTPANNPMTNGKAKKRPADEDSSSSSSSDEDEDEANGSKHIPRGRRAGAVLETKKRKSSLSWN